MIGGKGLGAGELRGGVLSSRKLPLSAINRKVFQQNKTEKEKWKTPQIEMPSWVKDRQEKLEKEKEDRSQFFKFPKGETVIEVDTNTAPVELEKFSGKRRTQYKIKVNNEVKTLEVGVQLDTLIINALMQNLNPMTVIRIGDGIKTQYSIKELK